MDKATEIFEKHWIKRTGKPLDETTKAHMSYAIEAVNEALTISSRSIADEVGRHCPFCGELCPECGHKQ